MRLMRRILSRITGISTPLRGLSWSATASPRDIVQTFSDVICITSTRNRKFLSFLKDNAGRIVFLRTHIDACVGTPKQVEFVEGEKLDLNRIASGSFSIMPLPLPNDEGELVSGALHFADGHVLNYSAGGTGVVMVMSPASSKSLELFMEDQALYSISGNLKLHWSFELIS
jgi:hypothetical protein